MGGNTWAYPLRFPIKPGPCNLSLLLKAQCLQQLALDGGALVGKKHEHTMGWALPLIYSAHIFQIPIVMGLQFRIPARYCRRICFSASIERCISQYCMSHGQLQQAKKL